MYYMSFYPEGDTVPDTCQDFINIYWVSEWISGINVSKMREITSGHGYHWEGNTEVFILKYEKNV